MNGQPEFEPRQCTSGLVSSSELLAALNDRMNLCKGIAVWLQSIHVSYFLTYA